MTSSWRLLVICAALLLMFRNVLRNPWGQQRPTEQVPFIVSCSPLGDCIISSQYVLACAATFATLLSLKHLSCVPSIPWQEKRVYRLAVWTGNYARSQSEKEFIGFLPDPKKIVRACLQLCLANLIWHILKQGLISNLASSHFFTFTFLWEN